MTIDRRTFLAAAAATGVVGPALAPDAARGSLAYVEHVVILMQENMSVKQLAPYANQPIFPVTVGSGGNRPIPQNREVTKRVTVRTVFGSNWWRKTRQSLKRLVDALGLEPRTR